MLVRSSIAAGALLLAAACGIVLWSMLVGRSDKMAHAQENTGGPSADEAGGQDGKAEGGWCGILTPEQYRIMRQKGTEWAFTGKYWDHKAEGVYRCAACGQELFGWDAKFDSGTGWPSFSGPRSADSVREASDMSHGMVRTEILCSRCGGHLGHTFTDGPEPAGLRYCINSAALKFEPKQEQMDSGDADARKPETPKAMFGAGCFWGVEAAFRKVNGVVDTAVGYSGGPKENPTYREVCTDRTGHAEVVLVTYDPAQVSYEELLDVFWRIHDPTQRDRQGPDIGRQYRSVVFYFGEEQRRAAEKVKSKLDGSGRYARGIVTAIEPAGRFWRAEEYHQRCNEKRGSGSCPVR